MDWASEFECDFPTSGGAVFDVDDVAAMNDGWIGLQGPRGAIRPVKANRNIFMPDSTATESFKLGVQFEPLEREDQEPERRRRYVSGVDVGRRHDPTVVITLDATELPFQVVHYERLIRAPFAQTQAVIESTADQFGGEVHVEANNTGDAVIEGLRCRVQPWITSARSKADALTALVRAVENREIKCGIPQVLSELKSYQWEDSGIVQDSVIALAIAVYAAGKGARRLRAF
jgi:hypothetical protein